MSSTTDPFDHEFDADVLNRRYQLCRVGFFLLAAAALVRAVDVGLHIAMFMTMNGALLGVFEETWYLWVVRGAMVGAGLVGAYLLWGRWDHPKWTSRTGLLITVGLVDLVLWVMECSDQGGQGAGLANDHHWVRLHLARAVSWAQLGLGVGLAAAFLDHLGHHREARSAERIYGFIVSGIALWLLYFARQTGWSHGWPLQQRRLDGLAIVLLLSYFLPLTLASAQLMTLDLRCARESARLLDDWRRHLAQKGTELLKSRSEQDEFKDLFP